MTPWEIVEATLVLYIVVATVVLFRLYYKEYKYQKKRRLDHED